METDPTEIKNVRLIELDSWEAERVLATLEKQDWASRVATRDGAPAWFHQRRTRQS